MLPPAARLRRSAEFATAVGSGVRAGRPTLVVHLLTAPVAPATPATTPATGPDPEPTRVGFVVSRAVGGAVVRNRVRRRLRHLVRARLAELPDGARLVVRALPPAARASFAELAGHLDDALATATRRRAASA